MGDSKETHMSDEDWYLNRYYKDKYRHALPDFGVGVGVPTKRLNTLVKYVTRKQQRRLNAIQQKKAIDTFLRGDRNPSNFLKNTQTKQLREQKARLAYNLATAPYGGGVAQERSSGTDSRRADRRKNVNANVRRDLRRNTQFSQRTTARTADMGAEVKSSEKGDSGFTQRTGGMTTTDISKFAPPTFHNRGIRDRRTAGGNLIVGDRSNRDIRHTKRYMSATEQAIIDRKIRNTLAENKLEEEIKKVRASSKERVDNLLVIQQSKQKLIDDLNKVNKSQLHSHQVITKAKMNATILGSDAAELNKIIARGGNPMLILKDMVRKGEISDPAIIGQLDFKENNQTKSSRKKDTLLKLLNEGSEWIVGETYYFKEFDDMGRPKTSRGFYQRGGERGSNLQLQMDNGDIKLVRKRSILLPEVETVAVQQLATPTLTRPSVSFADDIRAILSPTPSLEDAAPQSSSVNMVNSWLEGSALQSEKSSSSSDVGSFKSQELSFSAPEGDAVVARYNSLLPQLQIDDRKIKNLELQIQQMDNDGKPIRNVGLFGINLMGKTVTDKDISNWEERRNRKGKALEYNVGKYEKEIKEANAIAAEKGFDIPFTQLLGSSRRGSIGIPAKSLLAAQGQVEELDSDEEPLLEPATSGGFQSSLVEPQPEPELQQLFGSDEEEEEDEGEEGVGIRERLRRDALKAEERGLGKASEYFTVNPETKQVQLEPYQLGDEEKEEQRQLFAETIKSHLLKQYELMEKVEGDERYAKFKWKGLDLVVDTQTDTIIDPEGVMKQYKVKPFTKPTRENFIDFPTESEKVIATEYAKRVAKEKVEEKQQKQKRKEIKKEDEDFSFTKTMYDSRTKTDEINSRSGDTRLFVWSTLYPTKWDDGSRIVKGKFLNRSDYESAIDGSGITNKAKANLLAKFDEQIGGKWRDLGIKDLRTNNQKFISHLGLMSSVKASIIGGGDLLQMDRVELPSDAEEGGAGAFNPTDYN